MRGFQVRVLVDARTDIIKPGWLAAHTNVYEKQGFPVQLRHMGKSLAYLQAESGELNTLLHLWVYENAADREKTSRYGGGSGLTQIPRC